MRESDKGSAKPASMTLPFGSNNGSLMSTNLMSRETRFSLLLCGVGLLFSFSLHLSALLLVAVYIALFHGDFWYRSYLTLNRDLSGLLLIIRIKLDLWRRLQRNESLGEIWLQVVKKRADQTAMIDIESGQTHTFGEFNHLINQYANFFQDYGLRSGDTVALFMENSTQFVAAWMGLAKLGVASAWINSNLKSLPLAHSVKTSKAKAILTTNTLQHSLRSTLTAGELVFSAPILVLGRTNLSPGFQSIDKRLEASSKEEPSKKDLVDFKSILCFIYTSGTTGLPKAAVMKHFRYYSMAYGTGRSLNIRPSDRLYVSMPIYHTAAGILGVGQTIINGSCCVIRKKFSASNFWRDCVKYDCTVSQYIGEICRYLLAQPFVPEESQHRMRLLFGNGLRAEIWQPFVDRFRVRIGEVYGSTEGTSSLVNIDGHVGACGFLPISPLTKKMHPVRLVRVDDVTGEIIRTPEGLCLPCQPGETGAMLSTIRKNNPLLQFEGYLNDSETSKKIIRNVFTQGDSCFLTGDLLHWDRLGYVYFKDRTGDTYRWKGENVSTTEVEAVIHPIKGVADATVYGVVVPGNEGRAGMVAVVRSSDIDTDEELLSIVSRRLQTSLTSYALPVFLRICPSVDKTGTFKLVKTNLQRLGFRKDDKGIHKVYVFHTKLKDYIPLTEEILQQINSCQFYL